MDQLKDALSQDNLDYSLKKIKQMPTYEIVSDNNSMSLMTPLSSTCLLLICFTIIMIFTQKLSISNNKYKIVK